ncbi:MAG: alpha-L-fucosidase [Kiritimatiellaeota bacterium]|nr:alpha-L-fucosidase [Kiritimatiellota bacterium]
MTRIVCGMIVPGLLLFASSGSAEDWQHTPTPVPQGIALPAGPFQPTWASLQKYQVPEWFRDAKVGVFVHWGPQTLAGAAGSADGSQSPWQELAKKFTGEKFDATHLAKMFKLSGAKYVVQVAEHHDAYALYASSYTPWSSVKMNPKRDFVAELSAATRKAGLIWGASSHTEENWWFYSDPPKKAPPAPLPGRPMAPQPDKKFLDWWYARLVEIVDKYQPQMFWFDWCIEQPGYEPYLQKFAAHFYNRGAEWKQGIVLNYKYNAFPANTAVLDISWNTSRFAWKPERVQPAPWQFDTMSNRKYWFWRADMEMRPTAEVLCELADVVSKNGNYLLNIPPALDVHPMAR